MLSAMPLGGRSYSTLVFQARVVFRLQRISISECCQSAMLFYGCIVNHLMLSAMLSDDRVVYQLMLSTMLFDSCVVHQLILSVMLFNGCVVHQLILLAMLLWWLRSTTNWCYRQTFWCPHSTSTTLSCFLIFTNNN